MSAVSRKGKEPVVVQDDSGNIEMTEADCVNKCKQTPLNLLPLKTLKLVNQAELEWVNKAGPKLVNKT